MMSAAAPLNQREGVAAAASVGGVGARERDAVRVDTSSEATAGPKTCR